MIRQHSDTQAVSECCFVVRRHHWLHQWCDLCTCLPHLLERDHLAPAFLRRIGRFRGVGCRDRFHEAADFLRRAPLHIVGDVRIGVQREARAVVAQHTGQGFHIHAAGDRHGRKCVPLRYNYDKPEKPRISRVFGYLARFFILFQTEKSSREVIIS